MCEFLDKVEKRGFEKGFSEGFTEGFLEGFTEGLSKVIKILMEKLNISFEEALDVLGIPDSEKERYIHSIS